VKDWLRILAVVVLLGVTSSSILGDDDPNKPLSEPKAKKKDATAPGKADPADSDKKDAKDPAKETEKKDEGSEPEKKEPEKREPEKKEPDAKEPEEKEPEAKQPEVKKEAEKKDEAAPGPLKAIEEKKEEKIDPEVAKKLQSQKYKDAAAMKIDPADTTWMLVSSAFVMLMVPGLALFYGGLVRSKNVLGTMMHSMVALGIIGVFWVGIGYSLAFGPTYRGYIGYDPNLIFLNGVYPGQPFADSTIPIYIHCMYQGMFAIITPALISGALAERIKFGPYCFFILVWSLLVYVPLAHWVWAYGDTAQKVDNPLEMVGLAEPAPAPAPDAKDEKKEEKDETPPAVTYGAVGWLGKIGALDFAGGTVVHIAAGFSGLAAILAIRRRHGYPTQAMHPNSIVLSLTGAGLLWFGWFGFNGGSGLGIIFKGVDEKTGGVFVTCLAASAFTATQVAAAAAAVTWALLEWVHRGKPTGLGLATGIVAGLVAITPASGFVNPAAAAIIGVVSSVVCYLMVILKPILRYDDSLDAFGVHGIGGLVGALMTGLFASTFINSLGADGMVTKMLNKDTTDVYKLLFNQTVAAVVAIVYSFVITFVLVKMIDVLFGFTLSKEEETQGLDNVAHGEAGFDFGTTHSPASEGAAVEPKAAIIPPTGLKRFVLVLDSVDPAEAARIWSEVCHSEEAGMTREMKKLYPHLTTVQGNRFRFRSGDPATLIAALEKIFAAKLPGRKPRAQVATA
jgi:ammonium transporter